MDYTLTEAILDFVFVWELLWSPSIAAIFVYVHFQHCRVLYNSCKYHSEQIMRASCPETLR
jgi:hypothetical protein